MIHIVTALLHEARPLIDFYRLRPIVSDPFKIYRSPSPEPSPLGRGKGEWNSIFLIVSGVGQKNSYAAANYLYEHSGKKRSSGWLNVGIGGHSSKAVDEGVLAHKITDKKTGRSWYPPRILKTKCQSESVLTVEKAEMKYQENSVYDMEAAGFYEAASSCSTSELVQCFKIISDNLNASSRQVSGAIVRKLVAQNLNLIDLIVNELSNLSARLSAREQESEEIDLFIDRWHFTMTQSYQLSRLLHRLKTLQPEEKWFSQVSQCSKSKEVLTFLERRISDLPVYL